MACLMELCKTIYGGSEMWQPTFLDFTIHLHEVEEHGMETVGWNNSLW